MTPRIKVSLLVLAAIAAIGAVSATAAQAGEFTAQKYPATVTGIQVENHVFTFGVFSITCKTATFEGKLLAPSSELTVGAEYFECQTNNGKAAVVMMRGCDYRLHAGETLVADEVDGSLDIECEQFGEGIDFFVPFNGCDVTIPAQSGLETLVFTDNTEVKDFDIDINLVEIAYVQNASCPGGELSTANGEYSGKSTVRADSEGAVDGMTVD